MTKDKTATAEKQIRVITDIAQLAMQINDCSAKELVAGLIMFGISFAHSSGVSAYVPVIAFEYAMNDPRLHDLVQNCSPEFISQTSEMMNRFAEKAQSELNKKCN